jgi:beta-glucosidase
MYKAKLMLILLAIVLAACSQPATTTIPPNLATPTTGLTVTPTNLPQVSATPAQRTAEIQPPTPNLPAAVLPVYRDPSQPIELRVDDLLAQMTLQEKIGQMTQIEKNSLTPKVVTQYLLGSVLSGGDGYPAQDRAVPGWVDMVNSFQEAALATRLGIPLIYGVDAVHGFGSLYGATLFPKNIGLGATRDPDLVERIGQATAEEVLATGIRWNFAPVVAVPQDIRWGRTYEGYSENTELVSLLGAAYLKGLQNSPASGPAINILAAPKHFIGDGGTTWGTSTTNIMNHPYQLDQGDMRVDEATFARALPSALPGRHRCRRREHHGLLQ